MLYHVVFMREVLNLQDDFYAENVVTDVYVWMNGFFERSRLREIDFVRMFGVD